MLLHTYQTPGSQGSTLSMHRETSAFAGLALLIPLCGGAHPQLRQWMDTLFSVPLCMLQILGSLENNFFRLFPSASQLFPEPGLHFLLCALQESPIFTF